MQILNIHILVSKKSAYSAFCALLLPLIFTGCLSNNVSQISDIPKAFEIAIENTKDENYPRLADIPQPPKNMLSMDDWNKEKTALIYVHKTLIDNKLSQTPRQEDLKTDWALKLQKDFNSNPRLEEAPNMDEALEWAARMRAKLNN